MKLRSLLLGSGAALVATPLFAADAIIVEREPVEYVRVCDAYGSGYHYIPGTDTCLRISGLVHFEIGFSSDDDGLLTGYYGYSDGGYDASVRGRVNFDARTETEFGTLRSLIRIQADGVAAPTADPNVDLEYGFMDFAGFRMGYAQTAYEGAVGFDAEYLAHTDGEMNVGQGDFMLLQYTYTANGFGAAISLEDDADGNHMPNLVGVLEYAAAWGAIYGALAYDDATDEVSAKIGGEFNIGERASVRGAVFYATGDNIYGAGSGVFDTAGNTATGISTAEWSVFGSVGYDVSDTIAVAFAGQYFWELYGTGSDVSTGVGAWQVEANLAWEPVADFEILTGVAYRDYVGEAAFTSADADGEIEGFIRFTRSF